MGNLSHYWAIYLAYSTSSKLLGNTCVVVSGSTFLGCALADKPCLMALKSCNDTNNVQEALAALETERSNALRTLRDLRARQGKGLLTRLVTEQRFTLALPHKAHSALQIPEVKRYEKMLSP